MGVCLDQYRTRRLRRAAEAQKDHAARDVTLDDDLMERSTDHQRARLPEPVEAIRDLARAGFARMAQEAGSTQDCVGVLSHAYDHAARNLARRLTDTFHHRHDLTVTAVCASRPGTA
jgi:nickel-responsive transcriptional regulator NikR